MVIVLKNIYTPCLSYLIICGNSFENIFTPGIRCLIICGNSFENIYPCKSYLINCGISFTLKYRMLLLKLWNSLLWRLGIRVVFENCFFNCVFSAKVNWAMQISCFRINRVVVRIKDFSSKKNYAIFRIIDPRKVSLN